MMMVLERYALLDHVNSDVASSNDPGWRRMDSVVLNWISNSITPVLHQVIRERGATAHHLWLAIENQFLVITSSARFTLMLPSVTLCRVISP
jgi:hypothetical protein